VAMTTVAFVLVTMLVIVGGAQWLTRPMHADDESHPPGAIRLTAGLPHVAVDQTLLASMRRHPSAQARPQGAPIHVTPHLRARARVVFAAVQDGRLVLDCVIIEALTGSLQVAVGLPITLSMGALDTPWLAVHIEVMLERWAEGERVIDLELVDSPLGPRATLVSASSRLVLPLSTVAGLT
jgi:hypothetical protein